MKRVKNIRKYITAAVLTAAVLVLAAIGNSINGSVPERREGVLRVTFFDCKEADGILIQSDLYNIMIDTGGENYEKIITDVKRNGVTKLDCFIISHYDSDHCDGAFEVIDEFSPELILAPYANADTRKSGIYQLLMKTGAEFTEAVTSDRYFFGDIGLHILAPNNSAYTEDNENSIVVKLTYGNTSFLFTGDTTESEELVMLSKYKEELKSDVLKVSHHGSGNSSCEKFLSAVSPDYAVISCGANNYGHPSEDVLQRLHKLKTTVCITWEQGNVIMDSNKEKILCYFIKR